METHKSNGRVAVTGNLGDRGLPFPSVLSLLLLPGASFAVFSVSRLQRTRSPPGLKSSRSRCSFIKEEKEFSLLASLKRIMGKMLIAVGWAIFLFQD